MEPLVTVSSRGRVELVLFISEWESEGEVPFTLLYFVASYKWLASFQRAFFALFTYLFFFEYPSWFYFSLSVRLVGWLFLQLLLLFIVEIAEGLTEFKHEVTLVILIVVKEWQILDGFHNRALDRCFCHLQKLSLVNLKSFTWSNSRLFLALFSINNRFEVHASGTFQVLRVQARIVYLYNLEETLDPNFSFDSAFRE